MEHSSKTGRIVTLTPSPTLDAISLVGKSEVRGGVPLQDVLRVPPFRYQIGGKGVTCGRVLRELHGDCLAIVLLGRDGVSRCVEYYLRRENLRTRIVRSNALGRVCVILSEVEDADGDGDSPAATGVDYRINGDGSRIDSETIRLLTSAIRRSLRGAGALVLAGSLPQGAPADYYAQCIRLAQKFVPLVMLDSSREPLLHGASARPNLIKINAQEAGALMQETAPATAEEAAGIAWRIMERFNEGAGGGPRIEKVIITLGAKGASAVDAVSGGRWAVQPPRVKSQGALGAGDSFSAGLAYALTGGKDFIEALRWGAACGAATAMKRPGEVGDLENILHLHDKVEISPLHSHAEVAAGRI